MNAIRTITAAVADIRGVALDDILSDRRSQRVVRPRHEAMYFAKALTPASLPAIGRRMGGRDHTTVLSGIRRVEDRIASEAGYGDEIEAMGAAIRQKLPATGRFELVPPEDVDVEGLAAAVAPTLLGPLPPVRDLRARVDPATWRDLVERPLGEAIERRFTDHLVRGVVATDALIGTFALAESESLTQNVCFLYHLLGGGTLTSRLGDEIREKRGLAYYAYSSLSWQQHGAWFSGGFGTRNSQAPDALGIYMQTVRDIQAGNITQKELDDAKGYLTGAFPLALADNDGLAGMLISMQRYDLGKDYIAKRNDYIEAVTLEEVKRVAGEVLHPSRMVVVAVGDPAKNLADYR